MTRCARGCKATISEADIASPNRVLVFGGYGQVGEALARHCRGRGTCDPASVVQLARGDADVSPTRFASKSCFEEHGARAPSSTAPCFQPVDLCETEPAEAFRVNTVAAGMLARACKRASTRLVHLSTDYVFGGPRRVPFREIDLPAPQNVYAVSKLAGEHLVLAASEMHMVIRTSAVYGRGSTRDTGPLRSSSVCSSAPGRGQRRE